jgi:hypothetical protein
MKTHKVETLLFYSELTLKTDHIAISSQAAIQREVR